jgi:hypothetical protein
MAESELGVVSSQCLDRRIPDKQTLIEELAVCQLQGADLPQRLRLCRGTSRRLARPGVRPLGQRHRLTAGEDVGL